MIGRRPARLASRARTRHTLTMRSALVGGALACTLIAASCGNDDEVSSDDVGAAVTDVSNAVDDAVTEVSDAASDASDVVAAVADSFEDVGDTIEDATDGTDDGASGTTAVPDGSPPANPCAAGESGTLGETEPPEAGATPVEVTAEEYEFEGLDAIDGTGEYALTLTNEGQELHELVLVRIDDDETRPIEELLQETDPSSFATDVAFVFACPGDSSAPTAVSIDEPGRYVAVCFIPVGATPETPVEALEEMGPPHALQGMVAELQVS